MVDAEEEALRDTLTSDSIIEAKKNAEINQGSKDYDPDYIRSHVEKLTS